PTPDGSHTFPEFCRANGLEDYEPIEYSTFARYGMEFQRELVPYVENTRVTNLTRNGGEFDLTLESGEVVRARRVVVATGLTYLAHVPEVFAGLPSDRIKHTWGFGNFEAYTDKDVIVIGGGSSALERAALLHEHGARVRVLVRREVHWGGRGLREWERPLVDRIRVPISSVGHGRENWVLQHVPWLMHYLPASKRLPFTRKHLGPAPAWWLRDRVDGLFPVQHHTSILAAKMQGEKVCLRVHKQGVGEYEILADCVVAGTGYAFELDRLAFLDRALAQQVERWDTAPKLSRHFESSVPGLYFIGPISAPSFGPLVRFVAGSAFSVRVVSGHLASKRGLVERILRGGARVGAPVAATPDRVSNLG
ncbi:MAG: NAD(P)-binding domain-containing protein, partial [Chloroflexi bacterium]|nr:NAD(P)-binding domain-containing protein [Chloroflexota bacterium]